MGVAVGENAISARFTGAQWLLSVGRTPLVRVDTRAEAEASGRQLATALGLRFEPSGVVD
ncbi:hypothetical protein [Curtobacterium sp. MCBD17_032]|uniref:hypothetical protein n=1 Tax=Curtobacterium sp. MCBD17_032 TaxID=2175659 RepID=UPI0011B66258|nr:hypothetical protein [Curtobacterium sp. MCBD17_032]